MYWIQAACIIVAGASVAAAPLKTSLYRDYIETVRLIQQGNIDTTPLMYNTRWQRVITNVPTQYMRVRELFLQECIVSPSNLASAAEKVQMVPILIYGSIEYVWKYQLTSFFEYTATLTTFKKTLIESPATNLKTLLNLFRVVNSAVTSYSLPSPNILNQWKVIESALEELIVSPSTLLLLDRYWHLHAVMNQHILWLNEQATEWRQNLARSRKWLLQSTSTSIELVMTASSRHMLTTTDILLPSTIHFIEEIKASLFVNVAADISTTPYRDYMAAAILSAKVPSVLRQFCIKYRPGRVLEDKLLQISYSTAPELVSQLTRYLQKSEEGTLTGPGRRRLGELCATQDPLPRLIGEVIGTFYKPLLVFMSGVDLTDLYSHWAHLLDQVGLVAIKPNGVPMKTGDLDMQSMDISFKALYRAYTTVFGIRRTAEMSDWLTLDTASWSGIELYYHTRGVSNLPLFQQQKSLQLQRYYLTTLHLLAPNILEWRAQLLKLSSMWQLCYPQSKAVEQCSELSIMDGILFLQNQIYLTHQHLSEPYSPSVMAVVETHKVARPDWRHGPGSQLSTSPRPLSLFCSVWQIEKAIESYTVPLGRSPASWWRTLRGGR